jgi:HEAT repeat protein
VEIPPVARELLDGKDFEENLNRLKTRHREAIHYFLSVLSGQTDYKPATGVHPVDASDAAIGAISALGKNDVEFLLGLLVSALQSSDMQPAFSLAWVLAHLDAKEAIDTLMLAMRHKNEFVRWAACIGLKRYASKRARPLLNAAAADRSSMVRSTAVEALKIVGDATSLAPLEKCLRDRFPGIRSAAAEAIEAIKKRVPPHGAL